jgi:hypothetical protein
MRRTVTREKCGIAGKQEGASPQPHTSYYVKNVPGTELNTTIVEYKTNGAVLQRLYKYLLQSWGVYLAEPWLALA